jgi:hypothetical protein
MAIPTQAERDAFLWMQGRMVELLLRHDAQRFRSTFDEHIADQLEHPLLARYRDLAVLFYLRDELFDSILPRIKRRLSFAAPRELKIEDLPPRGRIDWGRTATASWRDRPGEVPLEVQTRQRRRHFATPENLLTVATILEYRAAIQHLLDDETTRDSAQAIRHPLHEIVDTCTRELAFLQFAGLVSEASAIVAGYARTTTDDLEGAVTDTLLPGRNSAYDDLLDWRHRLKRLQLLDRTIAPEAQQMLGADPDRDNYLYQLWLFYELGELIQQRGVLIGWDYARMDLTFTWGQDDDRCTYRLQHDQAIAGGPAYWRGAPGVRPDFYVERDDRQSVRDDHGAILWREPGYVLDAKYYRPRDDDPKAPSGPIKRMIADLQLTGERHGALIFAFHGDAPDTAEGLWRQLGVLTPHYASAQYIQPDVHIAIWRVQPDSEGAIASLQRRLVGILDRVHQALRARIEICCHGVFVDTLSANAQGALASTTGLHWRDSAALPEDLEDLLVCPKPHIAPWRVDLVSLSRDCCANSVLCHIKHQSGAKKPQRLTALDEIASAIKHDNDMGEDAAVVEAATRQVLAITKRYAQLLQPDIANYRRWVRDELELEDLFDTTRLLSEAQRETLALGRFLWEQIDHIKASNFAGPTLLFTGVLEELTRITIYDRCGDLHDYRGKRLYRTLGTLGKCKDFGGANWRILEQAIVHGGYWHEQIVANQILPFSRWIDAIRAIADIRNHAAHEAQVARHDFHTLTTLYFGSSKGGIGVFNGLLLTWRAPSPGG